MKALDMDADGWEDLAQDCSRWRWELITTWAMGKRHYSLRQIN